MSDHPRIEVTLNGPYRVRGRPALVRTAQVETEYGEPVDFTPDEPLEAGRVFSLCRCGGSSSKPFCDDTHLTNGFDGTEVADRGARADRMRTFRGEGVTLTDDESLCAHASFCVNRRTHVWAMVRDAEDPEVRQQLRTMVSHCPSGRLALDDEQDDDAEPTFEPSVAVVADGPLFVRGGVEVIGADGEPYEIRNRVALCRCGRSGNKPFCDGTHLEVGFRDP